MLDDFIPAYCSQKYERVFALMPNEKDKSFRWKVIEEEFGYLMRNEEGDHFVSLFEKIVVLHSQIFFIKEACSYLLTKFDQGIADKLSLIYPADYTLKRSIELALNMCGTKEYDYEILNEEYKRLAGEMKGERITEAEFYRNIATISEECFAINTATTKVPLYTATYQNFLTKVKNKQHG